MIKITMTIDNIRDEFNNDNNHYKDQKPMNMVTVASIDELGSPSGDGAGGGEDNLVNISSVGIVVVIIVNKTMGIITYQMLRSL